MILKGSNIVVIAAAANNNKSTMNNDDLFVANANIISEISHSIGRHCPNALIAILTNPINSLVPVAAEILRNCNAFDPRKLFGVSTLATVRARTFIAEHLNLNPRTIELPIIGGHSKNTCVPILSQCNVKIPIEIYEGLTNRIRDYGGNEVVEAKNGTGSTTLAMAWAAARFINCLCVAITDSNRNPQVTSYVRCDITESKYFCSPLTLCPHGVKDILCVPKLNDYENCLLSKAFPKLHAQIQKGEEFVRKIECEKINNNNNKNEHGQDRNDNNNIKNNEQNNEDRNPCNPMKN